MSRIVHKRPVPAPGEARITVHDILEALASNPANQRNPQLDALIQRSRDQRSRGPRKPKVTIR